ncbi:MAG: hypothetical protein FJ044_04990, partial [Candidatus Cloacimonetes bacterium]|nr:hypothetical protein [Candidatus Cloacimonadota bacterium]
MTAKQKIPKFKNIQEEAKFWDTHDVTDFLSEMHDVKVVFAEPSPKEETITIRVQPAVKATLRGIASSKGLNLSTLAR